MAIERLLKRTLWCEALYDAYPNRFTLWLWTRAGNALRAERDRGIVGLGKVKWPGASAFIGSLTGSAKPHRPAHLLGPEEFWARQAQQRAYDHQQFMAAAGLLQSSYAQRGLQNAASAYSNCAASQYANLLGFGGL